jgi:hypothetical protein
MIEMIGNGLIEDVAMIGIDVCMERTMLPSVCHLGAGRHHQESRCIGTAEESTEPFSSCVDAACSLVPPEVLE